MSRAAYYPPANRTAQNFQPSLGRPAMRTVNVLVLHTTEGGGWPGYEGGRQAPTFTINCTSGRPQVRQHFPLPCAAMALVQPSGSLSTNRNNVAQVELVGTGGWATSANPRRPYTVSGAHTDWAHPDQMMLRAVADLIAWLHEEWEVPLRAPLPFDDWAGNHSHRMTASQWSSFTGICGHSHVWGNEHTDPGAFPIAACLKLAGGATTTTSGDDDMQQSDWVRMTKLVRNEIAYAHLEGQAQLINNTKAVAVENQKRIEKARSEIAAAKEQAHFDAGSTQKSINAKYAELLARIEKLEAAQGVNGTVGGNV